MSDFKAWPGLVVMPGLDAVKAEFFSRGFHDEFKRYDAAIGHKTHRRHDPNRTYRNIPDIPPEYVVDGWMQDSSAWERVIETPRDDKFRRPVFSLNINGSYVGFTLSVGLILWPGPEITDGLKDAMRHHFQDADETFRAWKHSMHEFGITPERFVAGVRGWYSETIDHTYLIQIFRDVATGLKDSGLSRDVIIDWGFLVAEYDEDINDVFTEVLAIAAEGVDPDEFKRYLSKGEDITLEKVLLARDSIKAGIDPQLFKMIS